MKEYTGTVAESWMPTYENVTREFITETLYKILFGDELPNFKFDFREDEAIKYIEIVLNEYSAKYDFYIKKSQKILQEIKQRSDGNTDVPVMIVKNHKQFFELLRQLYEKQIDLYFSRTGMSAFTRNEKNNFFEEIWLRATPDDFNNAEEFLKKQVDMVNDSTFEKYNEETCLGKIAFLDDNILCVRNSIARTWDENSIQFEIIIYDKNYYENKKLFVRPNYMLPVIRYGIYEKNGKKVCRIGSIQNKEDDERDDVHKRVDRAKYRVNKGVAVDETKNVEPKSLIALSIFINLMHQADIEDIEVPSMYVLDYEYHLKRSEKLMKEFKGRWPDEDITEKDKKRYDYERKYLERTYGKHDLISEIKSERQIKLFTRLLEHYPQGQVQSYPSELDSYYHISIPRVNKKDEIKNEMLQELYELVAKSYEAIEI